MNVAIVDDLQTDAKHLYTLLTNYCQNHNLMLHTELFSDGTEFIKNFSPNKFDIVFLDIYMPNLNGMDTAKQLFKLDPNCHIIFVSTSADYAVESYDVNALYYVIKPISSEKLELVLNRCKEALIADNKYLTVTANKCTLNINFKDILYIETKLRKLGIHTTYDVITTPSTYSDFLNTNSLDERFIECYRGIIINMDHISKVLDIDFLLDNGEKLPIRQREQKQIKNQYMNYMFTHLKNN